MSEREDRLLDEQLKKLEESNAEVDGDAGSDSDYEEGMGNVDVEAAPALTVE